MGIDYYTCTRCGRAFPDVEDYTICLGCEERCCEYCSMETFKFDKEYKCEFCFDTSVPEHDDTQRLDHVLKQLGKTREDIDKELPPNEPKDEYYCTNTEENHLCANKLCKMIGTNQEPMDEEEDEVDYERGICCVTLYKEDKQQWCEQCVKKNKT